MSWYKDSNRNIIVSADNMDNNAIEKMITAADNLAHVAAFVSGRLDVVGLDAKRALSLISECRGTLEEAASGYWRTKGTDEDGMPSSIQYTLNDYVFDNNCDYMTRCRKCGGNQTEWSDDYAPLFTIRCKKCNAHTKPSLTPDIARHRWIFDRLIECGKYREGLK